MDNNKMLNYIKEVLENMPKDWLNLTTHRLDIYNEQKAKIEFTEQFEALFTANISEETALFKLPTAYDYIRLGHPLSCVLEWGIAQINNLKHENLISFSSEVTPILAVLRKNLLENKKTQICYSDTLPSGFDAELIKSIYGYNFELNKVKNGSAIKKYDGSTIFIYNKADIYNFNLYNNIDFYLNINKEVGSILLVNGSENETYISEIQHVRRRETISMTPINCQKVLKAFVAETNVENEKNNQTEDKKSVLASINKITGTTLKPLVGSSGLSIQYAIMMGLVHYANENHKGKAIKFVVPPNCYGGTNDQARRVAACIENVAVVDLPVDGDNDMVQSLEKVLNTIAQEDAIPYIIAEIPTNPRVEVPDLNKLKETLSKERKTASGATAVDAVFILDQTFCPNVLFLGKGEILSTVRTLSYASGSKFPSGGKCTAGYVVGNNMTAALMTKIEKHLTLCDNEATVLQYEILAKQLPSMNQRIADAYKNTRAFVDYIQETLSEAKINFVSEELAAQSFTPSVFSL
ncbi:MAG: hypothetical protein ACPGR5_06805, partial [Chitinophagales bacterium]